MSNDSHFVSPHGDDWSVQRSNSERPSHVFNTQREAIDRAREISRNQGTELVESLKNIIRTGSKKLKRSKSVDHIEEKQQFERKIKKA